ncbi:MAG: hypothetical protein HY867_06180 [Chloroflexi bacterium]|nr:hypothetical protein [Chloroflexota bacterium]
MPASKPSTLSNRHSTRAERTSRADAESAVIPSTVLTLRAPAPLTGHPAASATWKRMIALQNQTKAAQDGKPIITAFDEDLLVKYCLLEEEVLELAKMRKQMRTDWEENQKAAKKIKPKAETLKTWVQMWDVVNGMFQRFQGMDARLDGKRKLLHSIAQSLYITPRSRAGMAIPEAGPEEPKSEMDDLLNG